MPAWPHASSWAEEGNIPEASLTRHAFSSHQPRCPGPDTDNWGRPRSENFLQPSTKRGGREKLNYQALASVFPSSNSGRTLWWRSQRSDQVISTQAVQRSHASFYFSWQSLLTGLLLLWPEPFSPRRGYLTLDANPPRWQRCHGKKARLAQCVSPGLQPAAGCCHGLTGTLISSKTRGPWGGRGGGEEKGRFGDDGATRVPEP